jgi:hypothetical protein
VVLGQSTLNDDIAGDTPGQQQLTKQKTWNTKNLGPRLENVLVREGGHLSSVASMVDIGYCQSWTTLRRIRML